MKQLWQFIKNSRDWLLIILGAILIIFAVLNLLNFNPYSVVANFTPAVDQEGFAPIFVPKPSAGEVTEISEPADPNIPERIVIDKIGLDAPIEISKSVSATIDGEQVIQYLVPEKFAAGWQEGSAPLGVVGNTVLIGHHNAYGKVFEKLIDLEVGDTIILLSGNKEFEYVIANKLILPEKDQPLEVRLDNGRWILTSKDERVTLVTCWPAKSNTHRLILVAVPIGSTNLETGEQLSTATPAKAPLQISTPAADLIESVKPTPQPTSAIRLTTPAYKQIVADTPTPLPALSAFIVRNPGQYSVNIRELPTIESGIQGSFKAGDEADGVGRTTDGTWIYIEYQGIRGWVDAELVQVLTPVDSLPTIIAPKTAP